MANSLASKGVFLSGTKVTASAGNAVALASAGVYGKIGIVAIATNTGQVYIGGEDVASTTNSGLVAGQSLEIEPRRGVVLDLTDIYVDSDVDGEGVDFYATY